jgi:membrane-associated phospholipid phosphatase
MVRTSAIVVFTSAGIALCLLYADQALYQFLHDNFNENTRPVPYWLKLPHRLLRSLEDWGENVFIAAVLFAMWKLDANRRGRVVCLIVGALLSALAVEAVKRTTGRMRPEVGGNALVFEGFKRTADSRGDGHSFPSGHTASAAAYSGALSAFYPPLRPAMIALCTGTGASRIWKERHFLSDCLVGGLIGWLMASHLAKSRHWRPIWEWLDWRLGPSNREVGGQKTEVSEEQSSVEVHPSRSGRRPLHATRTSDL